MSETILQVDALGMTFGGLVALDDINFTVRKNTITALIGPNGAGKTTVFNCLTGFYRPTHGQILFTRADGESVDVVELLGRPFRAGDIFSPFVAARKLYFKMFGGTHKIIKQGIARTFQNTRLFKEMTVMENLLVAQHQDTSRNFISGVFQLPSYRNAERQLIEKAWRWLAEFGLEDEANRVAKELAYGQQKKLEIVRSLCTNPRLICFDEPAAGLNNSETKELAGLIKNICHKYGVTVFIIEHDMSLVMQISDHVVVLDSGAVISAGTPAEVKNDPRVLTAYLGTDDDAGNGL